MEKVVRFSKKSVKYTIAIVNWLIYSIIVGGTTTPVNDTFSNIWYLFSILLFIYTIFVSYYRNVNYKIIFLFAMVMGVISIVTYTSNYSPLLAWGLMIFAVRDIECDFIVSVYFKTFIVLGILIPLMAVTGLISNTVMDTVGITGKRYAYGFTHPNVLGAVLLVIVICWCYLHWKSIKLYHIVIINLLSYGMMQITDSSSSFICIAFISVIALLERWFDKKSKLNVWYFGIIVLLILAGISLNLVLGENGIITKAQEARDKTEQARINTEKSMNSLEQELSNYVNKTDSGNGGNSGGSQTTVENVVIPEGYYYVGGTKAKGIVISDNVADKELDKGKENVRRDLAGNQWVWVPVETPSSLYTTVAAGQKLDGSTGVKTTKYTNIIISGITRVKPGDTSDYREPDILTNEDNDTNAKTAGFSSLANMAETMKNDYEEMIASLEKYKGFYIGRYELTANGEKTGATQTSVNWYTLYKNCTTLAVGSKVKTRMIWGLQWDATCNWLASSGFSIKDSSTWGNYSNNTADGHGSKQNTGFSESWKANNIYDFAGNCYEFTQEAGSTGSRAGGGGSYGDVGSDCPASDRSYSIPTGTFSNVGSRPTLYLIP